MSANIETPEQSLVLTGERAVLAQSLMNLIDQQGGASSRDSNIITQFLRYAEEKHFLCSPITAASTNMLPGVEIQFTKVKIKTGPLDGEIFPLSGTREVEIDGRKTQVKLYSLHKPAVDRISLGRGVHWTESTRLDDESIPFRVRWQVRGWYYSPDMQQMPIIGTSEIDLSPGGPGEMKVKAESSSTNAAESRLRMMRYKIVQLAETNARIRAIFGQGIKMAYTLDELQNKFFICVQPVITGHCPGRPDLEAIYAQAVASNLAPNKELMYGTGSPSTMIAETIAGNPAPSIDTGQEGAGLSDAEKQIIDVKAEPKAWIIPFGVHKDKPINHDDITEQVLSRMLDYCDGALQDENQTQNEPFYTECKRNILAEIDRRKPAQTGSIDAAAASLNQQQPDGMKL
jgi:hypothetical protein